MIYLTPTETLGARLRRLRRARGWSQIELAIQVNTDQSNISKWERGRTRPQPYSLHKLATALGCTLTDLLT
jgi:transcriptional regulator with XRE-family HTH domain